MSRDLSLAKQSFGTAHTLTGIMPLARQELGLNLTEKLDLLLAVKSMPTTKGITVMKETLDAGISSTQKQDSKPTAPSARRGYSALTPGGPK